VTAPRAISAQHQREVWALLEPRVISLPEAGLLLVLLTFTNNGRIYPRVASIARRAGCSERLVQNRLKRLVELGVLRLVDRATQHRPNEYGFTPLALIARGVHRTPLDPAPGGTSATPLRGAQCAPDVQIKQKPPKIIRRQAGSESHGFCLNAAASGTELVSAVTAPKRVVGIDGEPIDEADDLNAAASEPLANTNRGRRAAGLKPRSRTPAVALASAVARPVEGKRARPSHADPDAALDALVAADPNCAILDEMFGPTTNGAATPTTPWRANGAVERAR
jgi:DNA-binding Lrp family transcriptional regulator